MTPTLERCMAILNSQCVIPSFEYRDDTSPSVTIPAKSAVVGHLKIYDDGDELTVEIGDKHHTHFSACSYDGTSDNERLMAAADAAARFVADVFADRVVIAVDYFHFMRRVWTAVATFLAGLCGCAPSGDMAGNSVAVAVPTGESTIEAAIDRARATIDEFKQAVLHPTPEQTDFSVKVKLHDDEAIHFVWLQQVACSGSNFTGTLGLDVTRMRDHRPGDTITVAVHEIYDWMYVERKKLVRGHTLRAIRDKLRGPQREVFERSLWFEMD